MAICPFRLASGGYLDGRPARYERITRARLAGTGKARIYSLGLQLGLSCNDYPMIWGAGEAERRLQLEQAIVACPEAAFEPFTPREVALTPDWGYLPCLNWPAPGPNWEPAAAPVAPAPDIPVLVVAAELDNVTSPKGGEARGRSVSRLGAVRGPRLGPRLFAL